MRGTKRIYLLSRYGQELLYLKLPQRYVTALLVSGTNQAISRRLAVALAGDKRRKLMHLYIDCDGCAPNLTN